MAGVELPKLFGMRMDFSRCSFNGVGLDGSPVHEFLAMVGDGLGTVPQLWLLERTQDNCGEAC